MIFDMVVGRAVAGDAELMKEFAYFARNNTLELQPPQKVGLRFFGRGQQTRFCGRQLSQDFAELT